MKGVVLLSGGLDSTTALAVALADGNEVEALYVDYGQRHAREGDSAKTIAAYYRVRLRTASVSLPWGGSSLLDMTLAIPLRRSFTEMQSEIASTYVPARNSMFLGLAASLAEVVDADLIYVGFNAIDFSGYPDCRPQYVNAMNEALQLGTKRGTEGRPIKILAPLVMLSKAEIVQKGAALGVPFDLTWTCYMGDKSPCHICDACVIRAKGFVEAGLSDPLLSEIAVPQ